PAGTDWNGIAMALTQDEQDRAAAMRFEKDRAAFMAGRYLQRSVLSLYTGLPARAIAIAIGPSGKPFLGSARGRADIVFNLTNAQGLAAFAISRHCTALGVDAEPVATRLAPAALSLFCSAAERDILSSLQGEERQSLLLGYWTLKESLLKAVGTGLNRSPKQVEIRFDRAAHAIRIDKAPGGDEWHHRLFAAASGHLVAISASTKRAALIMRQRRLPDPQ
ncbi:MAG: 4'-phosphopantetheinyl transferase family protein, partial [Alphaproteobacteria bacterium]